MNWKKLLSDPSLWILLIVNCFLVYQYEQSPGIFTTLIWLYWSQSVLYGVFNFVDMLTVSKVDVSGFNMQDATKEKKEKLANASAWVFLFHFGFFHFGYLIFIATMAKTGPFDWVLFKRFLVIFVVFQVITFIQHKISFKQVPANLNRMFITPYLRVVPMHLCILIPAFLNVSNLTVFLVLKVICDILMYIVTNDRYKKTSPVTTITAMDLNSTISSE